MNHRVSFFRYLDNGIPFSKFKKNTHLMGNSQIPRCAVLFELGESDE